MCACRDPTRCQDSCCGSGTLCLLFGCVLHMQQAGEVEMKSCSLAAEMCAMCYMREKHIQWLPRNRQQPCPCPAAGSPPNPIAGPSHASCQHRVKLQLWPGKLPEP